MYAALVTDAAVEDGKKRLTGFPVHIRGSIAALIPDPPGLVNFDIVIFLVVVGAVISFIAEVLREKTDNLRFFVFAPHMLIAGSVGVYSGNDGIPCRCTNRRIGIGMGIEKTLLRQVVHVRGGGKLITVTSGIGTVIFAHQPEDVGQIVMDLLFTRRYPGQ